MTLDSFLLSKEKFDAISIEKAVGLIIRRIILYQNVNIDRSIHDTADFCRGSFKEEKKYFK